MIGGISIGDAWQAKLTGDPRLAGSTAFGAVVVDREVRRRGDARTWLHSAKREVRIGRFRYPVRACANHS